MTRKNKTKSDYEKQVEKEAKVYEPMFWLVPESLRFFGPEHLAAKRERIEMKIEMRRVERMIEGKETSWLNEALYTLMMHTWFHVWAFIMTILSIVLLIAAYVAWFWFLGYVVYWLFTS